MGSRAERLVRGANVFPVVGQPRRAARTLEPRQRLPQRLRQRGERGLLADGIERRLRRDVAIDHLFVTSRTDLDARLAALDVEPDPDGRYRVNEFCCHDDTWQAAVVEPMQRADAVVMDLRGVTRTRHGCEFELKQLAERMPPRRLVLVADASTESFVLEAAFGSKLSAVRIIQMRRSRHTDALFEALLQAAA
jgi:hypothetical protein